MGGGLRRLVTVLLFVGIVGLTAGCGSALGNASDGGQVSDDGSSTGDTSPGELIEVGDDASPPKAAERKPKKQALPDGPEKQAKDKKNENEEDDDVRLEPLDKPQKKFPVPEMPAEPDKEEDELTHVTYELETFAWKAAGVVDEDTETDCSIDNEDLRELGSYDFTCTVSFSGVDIEYDVTAKVKENNVPITYATKRLPVSEEKAVHQATRQSFKPARVTCDIVGTETVRVGKRDGFTCWVTDVENNRTTYQGEVLKGGDLALRQKQ